MPDQHARLQPQLALSADGRVSPARQVASPNCNARPDGVAIELLVIHNISLPPRQYGGPGVEQLFTNTLDANEHPYYADIAALRVSSHFFIRRSGELVQFVPVSQRAWHAGISSWNGRTGCNDFSIGVELEGCDFEPFTDAQYTMLIALTCLLQRQLPLRGIAGHEDIAPGRKTDPGRYFDWQRYNAGVESGE
jgi:AmpD protein